MPSSTYQDDRAVNKVIGSISSIAVNVAGAGYQLPPDVTVAAPVSGTTATATSLLSQTSLPTGTDTVEVTDGGLYLNDGTFTMFFSSGGGFDALGTFTVSVGKVVSTNVTNGGSQYTFAPTPTFPKQDASDEEATGFVKKLTETSVGSYTVETGGDGYVSVPVVTVGAPTGTGPTQATATAALTAINAGEDILQNDVVITSDDVRPGGGAILRVYFSIDFDDDVTDAEITVTNKGVLHGTLNPDNANLLESDGYYRFDIGVEDEDEINFTCNDNIIEVHFFRTHLVDFGA